MPVFAFSCRDCGAQFDELVGSHVGVQIKDVRCPECEGKSLDRKIANFSTSHQLTANQKRRLEDKRGTDRGGAMARFKKQRATERRHHQRGRGA